MTRQWLSGIAAAFALALAASAEETSNTRPPVIDPGDALRAPADAIVLFDGTDASAWENGQNWRIEDGALVVERGKGDIRTKQSFSDVQLHVEWATPAEVKGDGQGRGNSGVFLMDRYEVQVLDSYGNQTYADGQAGAIYKESPPLVNASRPPGEWQTYDVVFRAPRFSEDGSLQRPATITVLHNGVLIQDHHLIRGTTFHDRPHAYQAHGPAPIRLQDHGDPVRFRNVWVRVLPPLRE